MTRQNRLRCLAAALASALLLFAASAQAARVDQVAVHYGRFNDAGNIDSLDLALSVSTASDPWPLTWLGTDIRYDFTVGQYFDDDDGYVAFVYAGPTWEYHPDFLWRGNYLGIGTALTWLGRSHVGDKNMGGRFQFTTHVTLGHRFGPDRRWRAGLRFQHTSSAWLETPNPGLDAGLLEIGYRFD